MAAQDARSAADALLDRLRCRTDEDAAYWDFARNHKRSHGHAPFPYPAMMVPQLQGALLDDVVATDPAIAVSYDPFPGSGTALTECIRGAGAWVPAPGTPEGLLPAGGVSLR